MRSRLPSSDRHESCLCCAGGAAQPAHECGGVPAGRVQWAPAQPLCCGARCHVSGARCRLPLPLLLVSSLLLGALSRPPPSLVLLPRISLEFASSARCARHGCCVLCRATLATRQAASRSPCGPECSRAAPPWWAGQVGRHYTLSPKPQNLNLRGGPARWAGTDPSIPSTPRPWTLNPKLQAHFYSSHPAPHPVAACPAGMPRGCPAHAHALHATSNRRPSSPAPDTP